MTTYTYRVDHVEKDPARYGLTVASLSRPTDDPRDAGDARWRLSLETIDPHLLAELRPGHTITLTVGTNRDPRPGPSVLDTLTDDWPSGGRT